MSICRGNLGRFICTGLYFFFCGIEYAVIIPTLNGYLISLDSPTGFIGIVMASFSLTGIIASPIFGQITDRTGSTKWCVVVSNLFEIGGNILYFVGGDYRILMGSRLIAGVGSGASSSMLSLISRTTTQEKRTGAFSLFMSLRQFGLLIGPALNIFLRTLNTKVGPFVVDQFTSPGLLMSGIWAAHTLLVLILFADVKEGEKTSDNSGDAKLPCQVDKFQSGSLEGEGLNIQHYTEVKSIPENHTRAFIDEFLREEVIVCLTLTFIVTFTQIGLEAVVTPMTLLYFDWGGLGNSYMFAVASGVVLIGFILLGIFNRRVSDRLLILFGIIGLVITYIGFTTYTTLLYFLDQLETPAWVFPIFTVTCILLTLSLPITWVPHSSLFSKITSMKTQGFNQGIRLAAMGFGQILGPIWASSMATESRLPIMSGINLAMMFMILLMVCSSYDKLVPPLSTSNILSSEYLSNKSMEENLPLLNND